jgi:hypothetical protein
MANAVKKKAVRRVNFARDAEESHIGRETVDWKSVSQEDYPKCIQETLRHYGYFYDRKDYTAWATAWVKVNRPSDMEDFKCAEEWRSSSTLSSLMRMQALGCNLTESALSFIDKGIEEVLKYGRENRKKVSSVVVDEDQPKVARKTPVELLREKTSDVIGEIEGFVDDYGNGTLDKDFSLYNFMKIQNCAGQTTRDIITFYKGMQEELRELVEDKTPDLVEGYGHLTTKQQQDYYNFISALISDAEKFLTGKNATRKPRKKKITPATKQVEKVIYQKENAEFKVTSAPPVNIIGAMEVYLFNTKTRVMKYLTCDRREGFAIRGTTILHFDVENSFKKKLRKPELMLTSLAKSTKSKALKEFKSLKTTETSADGRINADTVILKVSK